MRKIFFYLIIVSNFGFVPIKAQYGWFWQNPLPQGNFLTDITFVDSLNGWSAGFLGTILKTSNGGKLWESINTELKDYLKQVSFVSIQNG
jgi:hypothetical protein